MKMDFDDKIILQYVYKGKRGKEREWNCDVLKGMRNWWQ